MRIKKFLVTNMNEALKMIREDMGPEAVIISNYRLPRKGIFDFFTPRLIEVTAAIDERKTIFKTAAPALNPNSEKNVGKLVNLLSSYEKDKSLQENKDKPLQENEEENFNAIFKNKGNLLINREINQRWKNILTSLEINEDIVENLLANLADFEQEAPSGINEMYEVYMILLKSKIAKLLEPAYKSSVQRRINVFVGPSGVGKTLTLAKLATHYKMFDNKKVAIISADYNEQRPDLTENLRYYAGLIGIPVESADSQEALIKLIDSKSEMDSVLVDTPGTNSKNSGALLKLNNFLQPFNGAKDTFLVLSASTKNQDLLRTAVDYQKNLEYTKLVFTKLDETDTCGAVLNVVNKTQIPVTFVSYGQNVPDDITAVNSKKLAGLLLGGVERFVEPSLQIR
ncbi:MAG: hypothetical protein HGA27_01640 [Peptococcaceae bacterium]|nr:hypothetical protein [Peptococcaceae bacterium]